MKAIGNFANLTDGIAKIFQYRAVYDRASSLAGDILLLRCLIIVPELYKAMSSCTNVIGGAEALYSKPKKNLMPDAKQVIHNALMFAIAICGYHDLLSRLKLIAPNQWVGKLSNLISPAIVIGATLEGASQLYNWNHSKKKFSPKKAAYSVLDIIAQTISTTGWTGYRSAQIKGVAGILSAAMKIFFNPIVEAIRNDKIK